MLPIEFQYYPARVTIPTPLGIVSLAEFIEANRNPNPHIRDVFEQIALAEHNANTNAAPGAPHWAKVKAALKQENLYYFTPCVFTNGQGRKYENILKFTGIAVIEFDHIPDAESFKQFIFQSYNCVICAYVSPSKKGVKVLVKIPRVNTVQEFKAYYFGLALEFDRYVGFDGTGQNAILPLFLSLDPDLLYRDFPDTWSKKGKMRNQFVAAAGPAVIIDATDKEKAAVQNIIKSAVDKIVSDGHPQIRSAAVALGGYVASGYMTQFEAEAFLNGLISHNGYLQKGIKGYQLTAKTGIALGMQKQLLLKTNDKDIQSQNNKRF